MSKQLLPWPLGVRKLSVFKLVSCNLNGNPRPGLLYETFTAELRLSLYYTTQFNFMIVIHENLLTIYDPIIQGTLLDYDMHLRDWQTFIV